MSIIAKKIEIDFTDDKITSSGGSVFLSQTAANLGIPKLIDSSLGLKVRDRLLQDGHGLDKLRRQPLFQPHLMTECL